MKKITGILILAFVFMALSACTPGPNFVVDSNSDESDIHPGDGICETASSTCTLRAAIMEANASSDINVITFQGVSMIQPLEPLPKLTSGNIHIDGNGVVTLDGSLVEEIINNGLEIFQSSYNTIQGLTIQHFGRGIMIQANKGYAGYNRIGLIPGETGDGSERNIIVWNNTGVQIHGSEASENSVSGNHIGTGPGGSNPKPNEFYGISISSGAHDNLIGSLTSSAINQGGNLISGNNVTAIILGDAFYNHISGNYIGTKKNGSEALPNGKGIAIGGGGYNVIGIGPSGEGVPNLISGNELTGVEIGDSDHNMIAGNLIGTNVSGTASLPNRKGVFIGLGSSMNTIGTNGDGTDDDLEGNLISGNENEGIWIYDNTSIKNVIAGNLIGTNLAGTASLGNGSAGISVGGDMTLIGTNGDGVSDLLEANVISGNQNVGVFLGSFNCIVAGNYIGVDSTGMNALGNLLDGIKINPFGTFNIIGTDGDGVADTAERNVISGNGLALSGNAGISIDGDNNRVAGNFIGTDSSGSTNLGNLQDGIQLTDSASINLIGTDGDGTSDFLEGNLISGNGRIGIWLLGSYSNYVAGNLIGTDLNGTAALPNGQDYNEIVGAVYLSAGASGNIIGTNSDGQNDGAEGNLISGNDLRGVHLRGATTHFNIVAGNLIGTDISGSFAIGNQEGILVDGGANLNQIGTNGDGNSDIAERNLVSGNSYNGIFVNGSLNNIAGNFIGTDYYGTADLGNGIHGILIADTSSENKIGGSDQKANVIAFNTRDGIRVQGMNADKTLITYNSIHSNGESGINLTTGDAAMFTPNDPGDNDLGPNDLMNFPVLNSASSVPGLLTMNGQIVDGLPNTNFMIHFYANDICDTPSNHGEGKNYVGSTSQLTDGSGNVSFSANMASGVSAGQFITSTATSGAKTSEFSGCVEVADVQNYSLELDDERCSPFEGEEMTLTTFKVDPELLSLNMYVKKPSGFPGGDEGANEEAGNYQYTAFLGEREAKLCNFQGFNDRLYCNFIIPEDLLDSSQELKVFLNDCGPPIYVNENVTIFRKEPTTSCTNDLDERACIAAGGTYVVGAASSCICP